MSALIELKALVSLFPSKAAASRALKQKNSRHLANILRGEYEVKPDLLNHMRLAVQAEYPLEFAALYPKGLPE